MPALNPTPPTESSEYVTISLGVLASDLADLQDMAAKSNLGLREIFGRALSLLAYVDHEQKHNGAEIVIKYPCAKRNRALKPVLPDTNA